MDRVVRKGAAALLCLAALSGTAAAQVPTDGYAEVAALFEIGAGARPLGMGGAFVAVANDESAVFYNPAGLRLLQQLGILSLYSKQFGVVEYGGLAIVGPNVGLGLLYLGASGLRGVGGDSEKLGEFGYTNLAGLGAVGAGLGPFSVGVRWKYYHAETAGPEALQRVTGRGLAMDVGTLLGSGSFRIGALYQNVIGQGVSYSTGSIEPWAPNLTVGIASQWGRLTVGADVDGLGSPNAETLRLGAEGWLGPLAIRGGMWARLLDFRRLDNLNLTAGVGLRAGGLQIDYAYLLPEQLPETHRLSLTLRF